MSKDCKCCEGIGFVCFNGDICLCADCSDDLTPFEAVMLAIETEKQRRVEAEKTMELLGAMAGNPDAKEGCRLICKRAREYREKYKG